MDYRIESLDAFYNDWRNRHYRKTESEAVALADKMSQKLKRPARVIHDGKIVYMVNVVVNYNDLPF